MVSVPSILLGSNNSPSKHTSNCYRIRQPSSPSQPTATATNLIPVSGHSHRFIIRTTGKYPGPFLLLISIHHTTTIPTRNSPTATGSHLLVIRNHRKISRTRRHHTPIHTNLTRRVTV
ncbi:hypothetical protein Hanom_Chr12g01084881 [Helianthus anomalus]